MSKRLQVVIAEEELREYEQVARQSGQTLSEWVRQTLRAARRDASLVDVEKKVSAVRYAASLNLGEETDVETMLAQIESGYQQDCGDS